MTDKYAEPSEGVDRYAVLGNPIGHSKSPQIHDAFAKQTNQKISYEAILVGVGPNEFEEKIGQLIAEGYKGLNVTVPFKFNALLFVAQQGTVSPLANRARAVNTLIFRNGDIIGDNTDGTGLVRDVEKNLNFKIAGKRVLLLGSGGAAFGVLQPIADANPSRVVISNRTFAKAEEAARILSELIDTSKNKTVCIAKQFDQLGDEAFDLVINSTSTGLTDTALPIPDSVFGQGCLAYDMMYGRETPFMALARAAGATVADGLGMLVEQAAAAFYIWRGVRPETKPVIKLLRNSN